MPQLGADQSNCWIVQVSPTTERCVWAQVAGTCFGPTAATVGGSLLDAGVDALAIRHRPNEVPPVLEVDGHVVQELQRCKGVKAEAKGAARAVVPPDRLPPTGPMDALRQAWAPLVRHGGSAWRAHAPKAGPQADAGDPAGLRPRPLAFTGKRQWQAHTKAAALAEATLRRGAALACLSAASETKK